MSSQLNPGILFVFEHLHKGDEVNHRPHFLPGWSLKFKPRSVLAWRGDDNTNVVRRGVRVGRFVRKTQTGVFMDIFSCSQQLKQSPTLIYLYVLLKLLINWPFLCQFLLFDIFHRHPLFLRQTPTHWPGRNWSLYRTNSRQSSVCRNNIISQS